MTFSERLFWIKDNSDWLMSWYFGRTHINRIGNLPMQKFFLRDNEQFYNTLITTMVFSRYSVVEGSESSSPVANTMAGFVQQTGRLPTQDDKVQLLVYKEEIRSWKPDYYKLDLTMHMGWFYLIIPEANYGNKKESLGQSPSTATREKSETST